MKSLAPIIFPGPNGYEPSSPRGKTRSRSGCAKRPRLHERFAPKSNVMTRPLRSDINLYRRLLSEIRPYWPLLVSTFLVSLLSIPFVLLTPLPLKIAVDSVIGNKPVTGFLGWLLPLSISETPGSLLVVVVVLLLIISLLHQLQLLCTSLLRTYTGERLLVDFRAKLFQQAVHLSVAYHDSKSAADSAFRIQWDAPHIRYLTLEAAIPFFTGFITLLGMIYVTSRINWQLALIALMISPIILMVSQAYRAHLRKLAQRVTTLESSAASVVQEVLGALRVVKAFGREYHEQIRFTGRAREGFDARIQYEAAEGIFSFIIGVSLAAGTAIVLYVGIHQVQAGAVTLGELLLVMSYLLQLYEPLKSISEIIGRLQLHLASLERVFNFLDEMPDVPERSSARQLRRAEGSVVFCNVSFAYPGSERTVLHNASFKIGSGTRVGIVGATGAGKTTLVNLLARFYDPTIGEILLDGIDLRDYRVDDLRRQFAIVLQEPILFSTTIAENIAYGRPDATHEQIVGAAKAANIHEFIEQLPESYQSVVGERGMTLSGGERQRITLARAFLKDAPVLILDEPTSSVDFETEATIIDAMKQLMFRRTTFIIAHRMSVLNGCDVLLRVARGRLREESVNGRRDR
jgi:ATP-binding cassette, subfamily B, bacterial